MIIKIFGIILEPQKIDSILAILKQSLSWREEREEKNLEKF